MNTYQLHNMGWVESHRLGLPNNGTGAFPPDPFEKTFFLLLRIDMSFLPLPSSFSSLCWPVQISVSEAYHGPLGLRSYHLPLGSVNTASEALGLGIIASVALPPFSYPFVHLPVNQYLSQPNQGSSLQTNGRFEVPSFIHSQLEFQRRILFVIVNHNITD